MTIFEWIFHYLQFWTWRKSTPQYGTNFFRNKSFLALSIPFLLVFISGLWSDDLRYWLSRVQLRLPFLLIPFAFSQIPPLSKKQIQGLLLAFLGIISINLLLVLINYAFDFDNINTKIGQGTAMPFLKMHITFSVMAAFAVCAGIELWLSRFFIRYKWEKPLIAFLTVFTFIGLHIIAVRTGLIALYLCLILRGGILIFQNRQYILGFSSLILLLAIPLAAYQFVPSFQQRVNYAVWDFEQYKMGDPDNKSDSERLISLKMGGQIFSDNKIWGVGYGDILQKSERFYTEHYPNLTAKLPHNQWLLTAMGLGLMGLLASIVAFFLPLLEQQRFRNFTFAGLHLLIFVFCMTDIPFEGTFSLVFYSFFASLFLNVDAINEK